MAWETFSVWLITAGLVMGGLAGVAGLVALLADRTARRLAAPRLQLLGNALVFAVALVNAFVHSRDGYTAVVPQGLALSAVTVALLLITGWIGHTASDRQRWEAAR